MSEKPETTRPAILDYLLILAAHLPFHDENAKRLRIAVTAEEFQKIREYCLEDQEWFAQRLRDVPLIVEDRPMTSDVLIEYAKEEGIFGKYEVRRTL